MSRIHVAIGPISPRASWRWLGPHLASSLADTCTVRFFGDGGLPRCDVAIFIKERPRKPVHQACDYGCRIVYLPVDFYRSQAQLDADAPFLGRCSGLLVHSRPLGASLARHNSAIWHVDHPNLHGLAAKPPYRPDGYLLWIGDFLNLPYLLRWKEKTELPCELKVLTNGRHTSVKGMAMTIALAGRLGVDLDVRPDRINGIPMYEWDPATQQAMMAAAKAAVDIKGGEEDFSQFMKPPTKAQQFIVSGIPFATNGNSPTARDLLDSGFEVADVEDHRRWFSHEYWRSTQAFSAVLGARIHPEAVAFAYRRCLEEVIGRGSAGTIRSFARCSPVSEAPEDVRGLARWQGYSRAWRVLRQLGASWEDAAPHVVKRILQTCRDYVPGHVTCTELDSRAERKPTAVSVVVDLGSKSEDCRVSELAGGVRDGWEIIASGLPPRVDRGGLRFKSISRWPRRALLRDRMLASAYAEGDYLAFISRLTGDEVAWIGKAVTALETRPQTAMVLRARAAGADADSGATFVVRRAVWVALKGYHPGPAMTSPPCGDVDLLQRIRHLGYEIEPALEAETPRCRHLPSLVRSSDKVVVYTAITNGYDRLLPLKERCVSPARQIAYLDEATRSAATSTRGWEIRDIDRRAQDPVRQAKRYKILPDSFFPDAEYSLWVDGNISLIYPFDIHQLISLFLAEADMCVARHHARACLYQEAEVCKARRLDSPPVIDRQMARYRQEGFPAGNGLNEAAVILRRHSEAVKRFNRQWWQEICRGSRRDQLSFNYALWKTGLPIAEFPLSIQDNNGLFAKVAHARRRPFRQSGRPSLRAVIHRMEGFYFGSSPPTEAN